MQVGVDEICNNFCRHGLSSFEDKISSPMHIAQNSVVNYFTLYMHTNNNDLYKYCWTGHIHACMCTIKGIKDIN